MVDLHRAHDSGDAARAEAILNNPEYGGLIAQLLGSGAVEVVDDDENDPDYRPGQEEEELLGEAQDEEDEEEILDTEEIDVDDDDEDDGDVFGFGWNRPQSHQPQKYTHEKVTEPQAQGLSLLYSGEFGRIGHQTRTRNKDNNVAKMFITRGAKLRPSPREDLTSVCYFPRTASALLMFCLGHYTQLSWYGRRYLSSECLCRAILV